jgi:O-succinylbenzoate synthase
MSAALELHRMAVEEGMSCWVGSMLESGIGAGALIELASLDGFDYPGDLFPTEFFYGQDLTKPELVLEDDCSFLPSRVPGTPYAPVAERIKTATYLHRRITERC